MYYIFNNETTYGEDVESECIDIIKRISFDTYSVYTEWLGYESDIENIKPYLRPMSSMTEEERTEFDTKFHICTKLSEHYFAYAKPIIEIYQESIDWLNKHHFDYRGLIEKGLALEAPEGMYKFE